MTSEIAFPMLQLRHHERAIVAAVRIAGQQVVAMQSAIRDAGQVAVKLDGTIVTAADIASQHTLLAAIVGHAPHPHHIISEELPASPIADPADPVWFVDPLDGTRSYATGSADFAVLVSEWAAGRARFSVVYYPAIDQLAVAAGGQAVWSSPDVPPTNCADAPTERVVHMCYMRSLKLQRLVTGSGASYYEEECESTRALFDVATGNASAAVILLCGHKSWDLAPLLHLVVAAGGFVSDETRGPVRIRGPEVFGRYVIAARDPSLHENLAAALR